MRRHRVRCSSPTAVRLRYARRFTPLRHSSTHAASIVDLPASAAVHPVTPSGGWVWTSGALLTRRLPKRRKHACHRRHAVLLVGRTRNSAHHTQPSTTAPIQNRSATTLQSAGHGAIQRVHTMHVTT